MQGKDGKPHTLTMDASSSFDAVDKAVNAWVRLWWYDPDAIMTVRRGEESWRVSQAQVRKWRQAKKR
jgi:hypothetical protein